MSYIFEEKNKNQWSPKPLGLKGKLSKWQQRMVKACPSPKMHEVVWLDGEYWDQVSKSKNKSSVAYKVIGFKACGDAIWQRGQVIELGTVSKPSRKVVPRKQAHYSSDSSSSLRSALAGCEDANGRIYLCDGIYI
ncbi:hypothetical protein [Colwellia sp. 12G3]|uniref:hypothetical protein n=1 Tax=Colwellia sp. 12G3 TaxID=2058299 RepID=UPI000C325EEF|nr:hypothetical protein [Colwellia sp. 12G3]PKI12719.1 hypothetical protein CXF71_18465 [Colwellia sp. 12G3]